MTYRKNILGINVCAVFRCSLQSKKICVISRLLVVTEQQTEKSVWTVKALTKSTFWIWALGAYTVMFLKILPVMLYLGRWSPQITEI
jgi:hypothetical protein